MRILISNDDGIGAPGIVELAKAVSDLAEVWLVAPDRQRSASSHGISLLDPLCVREQDIGIPGACAFSVSGTPVDCVKWAIAVHGSKKPFDLMLSGINEGSNMANDVLYSGTVAAAGEARLQGVPSIAFSLSGPPYPYAAAAQRCTELVRTMLACELPADTFLNVNLPSTGLESADWQATQIGARSYTDEYHLVGNNAKGEALYRYGGTAIRQVESDDTDIMVVRSGRMSVTPLRYHFTNHQMIDSLKSILHQIDPGE